MNFFNFLFFVWFVSSGDTSTQWCTLISLVVSVISVLFFENLTRGCFLLSSSQVFFFLASNGFGSINSKSLSLLIFIIWTRVSNSWLVLIASLANLSIILLHIFNLFKFIFFFFFFDGCVNISHCFRIPSSLISTNHWLWSLRLFRSSAVCVLLRHESVLNTSDTKREIAAHWWFLFQTVGKIHKQEWQKWCSNHICKWFSHNVHITLRYLIVEIIIHFDMGLFFIILCNNFFVHCLFL